MGLSGQPQPVPQPVRGPQQVGRGAQSRQRPLAKASGSDALPVRGNQVAAVDDEEGTITAPHSAYGTDLQCNTLLLAVDIRPDEKCPDACPYWSESGFRNSTCAFKCVREQDCG